MPFASRNIKGYIILTWLVTVAVTLTTWFRQYLSYFSILNLLFYPPFHTFLKEFNMCGPHEGMWSYAPTHWIIHLRVNYLNKLLGIILHRLVFFHFFLFIQVFIYISMGSWILILNLGYNPILIYLLCCSNHSRFENWEVSQLAPVFF